MKRKALTLATKVARAEHSFTSTSEEGKEQSADLRDVGVHATRSQIPMADVKPSHTRK